MNSARAISTTGIAVLRRPVGVGFEPTHSVGRPAFGVAGCDRGRTFGGDLRWRPARLAAPRLVLGRRAARLRRLDARRFAGLLRVVRWPRGVAQALGLVAGAQLQERLERADRLVDAGPRVADRRVPRRDRVDRERLGLDGRHLVPGQRRGDARVGQRPDGVGLRHRPVLGVLVVVEEDAVALLLPPLRGGEVRARGAPRPGRARGPPGAPPGTSSAARSGR